MKMPSPSPSSSVRTGERKKRKRDLSHEGAREVIGLDQSHKS